MKEQLSRGLTFVGLTAFGLNIMIGSGIYFLPGKAMDLMGPASILAVVAAFAVAILLVSCFAELGSQFSETGGPIVYAREALGPAAAFGVGWLGYLSRLSSNAALVVILATSTVFAFPSLDGWEPVLIPAFLLAMLAINLGKLTFNAGVMDVVLVLKIVPLVAFIVAGAMHVEPANYTPLAPSGLENFGQTMLMMFYLIVGFELITVVAGETRDPHKNIPKVMLLVMAISAVLILSLLTVLVGVYPDAARSENPVAEAAVALFGPVGQFMSIGILLSVIGVNLSCALVTPRYLYALSMARYLPPVFARVSAVSRVPYVAVVLSFALIYVLTIGNSYVVLAVLAVIARLCQYIVSCIALLILRRRRAAADIPFRAPAGRLQAIGALLACSWLIWSAERMHLVWTLVALLCGYGLYAANKAFESRRAASGQLGGS